MSLNRVIGADGQIPWHLPEDFRWFKKMTVGNVIVMGRKTFESLGHALPSRKNLVLTRHPQRLIKKHPEIFGQYHEWRGGKFLKQPYQFHFSKLGEKQETEIFIFNSLDKLNPDEFPNDIFICGGAEIYKEALPRCSDLYLTLVNREVPGDTFFPPFENKFKLASEIRDMLEFKILHYRHKSLKSEDDKVPKLESTGPMAEDEGEGIPLK